MALLGDAAHPFTPHQGQGAGVAIEDAASLAVLLPQDVPTEEIPERLKLYEKIRMDRAHSIQDFSRMAGMDIRDPVKFDSKYIFGMRGIQKSTYKDSSKVHEL